MNTRPHNTPAEQTVSVWRSKSSPGGDGYNEILLDDKAGAERLDLRAQHDYHRLVLHDGAIHVQHNDFLTVDFNKTDVIKKAYSMSAGSVTISTGPYTLHARDIKEMAKETFLMEAGDWIDAHAPLVQIRGDASVHVTGGGVFVEGGKIVLKSGGSSITIEDGGIKIKSSGPIDVNGSVINLNC